MERDPLIPSEAPEPSEKSGEMDNSKKKKKKTTRIPLPIAKEDAADKPTEKAIASPENALEKLFEKAEQEAESTQEEASEIEEQIEDEINEPADVSEDNSIEGEFANEPVIITRAERVEPSEQNEAEDTQNVRKESVSRENASSDVSTEPTEALPAAEVTPRQEPTRSQESGTVEPQQLVEPENPIELTTSPVQEVAEQAIIHERESRPIEQNRQAHITRESDTVTRQELVDETYRAEKRGLSKGVASGGLAGLWLGHRLGKKSAEKETSALKKEHAREIKKLDSEQVLMQERLRTLERAKAEQPVIKEVTEVSEDTPLSGHHEQAVTTTPEVPASAHKESMDLVTQKQEEEPQREAEEIVAEESYQVPVGHRVEMSAWHRVEVDEKTGNVVENPEIAYGEEFKKERRQEQLQREAIEPKVAFQLGQHALTQADDDMKSSDANAKAEEKNSGQSPQKAASPFSPEIKEQLIRYTTNPIIWIAAGIFVVLLFVIGILR